MSVSSYDCDLCGDNIPVGRSLTDIGRGCTTEFKGKELGVYTHIQYLQGGSQDRFDVCKDCAIKLLSEQLKRVKEDTK